MSSSRVRPASFDFASVVPRTAAGSPGWQAASANPAPGTGATTRTTPFPRLRLDAVGRTDRGLLRDRNEDAIATRPDLGLLVLADGMGGRAAGEVAAEMAVETICGVLGAVAPSRLCSGHLVNAIEQANARIYAAAHESTGTAGMGTTVVAALAPGPQALVAHVGDSRAYLWRCNTLRRLTSDHTVQAEYQSGALRHLDLAKLRACWHALSRAVGTRETVKVDLHFETLKPGDVLLLCSDGLTGPVAEAEIAEVLCEHRDLDAAAEALIALANDRGGADNTSVVLGRWTPREVRNG